MPSGPSVMPSCVMARNSATRPYSSSGRTRASRMLPAANPTPPEAKTIADSKAGDFRKLLRESVVRTVVVLRGAIEDDTDHVHLREHFLGVRHRAAGRVSLR